MQLVQLMKLVYENNRVYNILVPYVRWTFRRMLQRVDYVGLENIPKDAARFMCRVFFGNRRYLQCGSYVDFEAGSENAQIFIHEAHRNYIHRLSHVACRLQGDAGDAFPKRQYPRFLAMPAFWEDAEGESGI